MVEIFVNYRPKNYDYTKPDTNRKSNIFSINYHRIAPRNETSGYGKKEREKRDNRYCYSRRRMRQFNTDRYNLPINLHQTTLILIVILFVLVVDAAVFVFVIMVLLFILSFAFNHRRTGKSRARFLVIVFLLIISVSSISSNVRAVSLAKASVKLVAASSGVKVMAAVEVTVAADDDDEVTILLRLAATAARAAAELISLAAAATAAAPINSASIGWLKNFGNHENDLRTKQLFDWLVSDKPIEFSRPARTGCAQTLRTSFIKFRFVDRPHSTFNVFDSSETFMETQVMSYSVL
uniref:Uncharacterized protein n=1 Tax=Romanomermis culicivorax TaxID=13658 RepID=A0A915J0F4_ROMCU